MRWVWEAQSTLAATIQFTGTRPIRRLTAPQPHKTSRYLSGAPNRDPFTSVPSADVKGKFFGVARPNLGARKHSPYDPNITLPAIGGVCLKSPPE